MTRYLAGCAYTQIPPNAKGVPAVFYPADEVGGYTETAGDSVTAGAKVVIIYGVSVIVGGAFLISIATPSVLITNFTMTTNGEMMFGEQGIEVRDGFRVSVPASSTVELIVYWKKVA